MIEIPQLPPVPKVLAALERDDSSSSVLATAVRFAATGGADVVAVHAGRSVPATLAVLAERAGATLRQLGAPADRALVTELEQPDVRAIVVGAGFEHRGHHPVGPTTRYVLERASKCVVVVPAGGNAGEGPLRRVLVPLEDMESSSRPILEALAPLLGAETEVEVLHVFTAETLPRMLDRPVRDIELLGRELLAKHCPGARRVLLRSGAVASSVQEVCEESGCDVVVLSWSQVSSGGRARVVHDVLSISAVPVLLLPDRRRSGPNGPTGRLAARGTVTSQRVRRSAPAARPV